MTVSSHLFRNASCDGSESFRKMRVAITLTFRGLIPMCAAFYISRDVFIQASSLHPASYKDGFSTNEVNIHCITSHAL